jgi:hypothetical protein
MSVEFPGSEHQEKPQNTRKASSSGSFLNVLFRDTDSFSRPQLVVFVLVFALVGFALSKSFAAAPLVASVELEDYRLPATAKVIIDPNASKNKAVALAQYTSMNSIINLPSESSMLTLNAKNDACPQTPYMQVVIDGKDVISNTAVLPTAWASYSANVNLARGLHSLSIKFNENNISKAAPSGQCSNKLDIDVISFYGPHQKPAHK